MADKEIAETLGIAITTVHAHTASIFRKMDVHSRSGAMQKLTDLNGKQAAAE